MHLDRAFFYGEGFIGSHAAVQVDDRTKKVELHAGM